MWLWVYSGIFTRIPVVGETHLRNADGEICQNISYDRNRLYLNCICQTMPCGGYVRCLTPHFIQMRISNASRFSSGWVTFHLQRMFTFYMPEITVKFGLVVIWWMVFIPKPIIYMSIMAVSGTVALYVK